MDFLQRNLFAQLRTDNFGTKEELEPMTVFKKKKIAQMMKNLNAVPAGAVLMNNSFLNRRLIKIQKEERHSIDTSIETLYLLRLLVSNINGILANGICIRGIIQLGQYLRTRGDKVDFIKLESWLRKLHIQRRVEKGANKLTLRSLYYNTHEAKDIEFEQTATGFVRTTGGTMRKSLRRSMRYMAYAPIETISNFTYKVFHSLSEIEE